MRPFKQKSTSEREMIYWRLLGTRNLALSRSFITEMQTVKGITEKKLPLPHHMIFNGFVTPDALYLNWGGAGKFTAGAFKYRPQNGRTFFLKFIFWLSNCALRILPVHICLSHQSTINQATQTIPVLMKKDLKGKKPAKTYNITEKERQKLIYMRQAQFTITNHISGWLCSQRTPEPSVFLV